MNIPAPAQMAASAHCGDGITFTEITNRRGSAVWKATGKNGTAALKVGRGDGFEITARESAVLAELGTGYFLGAGVTHGAAWALTEWLEGPSTWDVFEPVRKHDSGQEEALAASVDLCRAVADLHASGWVHADLQPAHGIHTEDGVELIDLAWAWRPDWDQGEEFNGGIVHLVAPELAETIGTGLKPVIVTTAAEVYALAGVIWTCATGMWPLDYTAAGIDRQACTPAELRTHIASGRVPVTAERPWPELQETLLPLLLDDPANRPTADELGKILETL